MESLQENEVPDFFVTIVSNKSLLYYPDNITSNFCNYLCKEIRLNTAVYEVGLTELFFSDNFKTTASTTATENTDKVDVKEEKTDTDTPKKTFFNNEPDDNIIKVTKFVKVSHIIKKNENESLNAFNTRIAEEISAALGPIVLMTTRFPGATDEPHTVLKIDDPSKQWYVQMSPNLSELWGYDTNTLGAGVSESKSVQSIQAFTNLSLNDKLEIRIIKQEIVEVKVEEPTEYHIEYLMDNIVDAMEQNEFIVSINLGPDGILRIDIDKQSKGIQFKLPESANKALGFDKDYVFTDSVQFRFEDPDTESKIKPIDLKILKVKSQIKTDQIIVSSNVVEPMFFGSSSYPILRIFLRPESENNKTYIKFSPVYYQQLSSAHFQNIRITLLDETLNVLPESIYPTTCVLHFRRKRLV